VTKRDGGAEEARDRVDEVVVEGHHEGGRRYSVACLITL
jgi:hypothetical protein